MILVYRVCCTASWYTDEPNHESARPLKASCNQRPFKGVKLSAQTPKLGSELVQLTLQMIRPSHREPMCLPVYAHPSLCCTLAGSHTQAELDLHKDIQLVTISC